MDKTLEDTRKDTGKDTGKDMGKTPPLNAKEEAAAFLKSAVIAVTIAMIIRIFFWQPFNIPSGSMKPTLLVGDYLFVSKSAYGYSKYSFPFAAAPIDGRIKAHQPQRGDVVVFKLPSNTSIDYIKRIIALPGETVQVKSGRLYINADMIPRTAIGDQTLEKDNGTSVTVRAYQQTLPGGKTFTIYEENDYGPLDNTPLFTVPENHYFVMGDNRDNSQDSRVTHAVGAVPFENLVGRADRLFFSTKGTAGLLEVWKWPWTIRYSRLFKAIGPEQTTPASPTRTIGE